MASLSKLPSGSWRVQIRKRGVTKSATFKSKGEAQRWAIMIESQIDAGAYSSIPKMNFAQLIDKYIKEVSVTKRGYREEKLRLLRVARSELGEIALEDLSKEHFLIWQNNRLQEVAEATVLRERISLSAVISQAINWGYIKENMLRLVEKPKDAAPRDRRYSQDEIDKLCFVAGFSLEGNVNTAISRTAAAMVFAIETAMRAGEICNMKWDDVSFQTKTVFLLQTKNGFSRRVPLSGIAIQILKMLEGIKKNGESVFQIKSAALDANFRRMKEKAGLKDENLHFHDTRREALTRLAKKVDVMTLAKISGHRDLRILQNTYYAPDMAEVANLLD